MSTDVDALLQSEKPVLLAFSAEWCGPCHAMSPLLDDLADRYRGRVRVLRVDVDDELELARRLEVMSVPTIILLRRDRATHRIVGAAKLHDLIGEVEAFLSDNAA